MIASQWAIQWWEALLMGGSLPVAALVLGWASDDQARIRRQRRRRQRAAERRLIRRQRTW